MSRRLKRAVWLTGFLLLWTLSAAGAESLRVVVGVPVVIASDSAKRALTMETVGPDAVYVSMQHPLGPGPFGFRSVTGGQTWADAPWGGASLGRLSDGTLLAFESRMRRVGPGEFLGSLRRSSDGGRTMEGPQAVPVRIPHGIGGIGDDGQRFEGPIFWRSLVEIPSGVLATMYGYFDGDQGFRSLVVRSQDHGRTWAHIGTLASGGAGFAEPTLADLRDGQLLAVMRTGANRSMVAAWSWDGGESWPVRRSTRTDGVDPEVVVMASGVVALAYGVKEPARERRMTFSLDGGQTWIEDTLIAAGAGGVYSGMREVRPGTLLVAVNVQTAAQTFQTRAVPVEVRRVP